MLTKGQTVKVNPLKYGEVDDLLFLGYEYKIRETFTCDCGCNTELVKLEVIKAGHTPLGHEMGLESNIFEPVN